ncbi:MAG: phosphoribosyltransferase family protein [Acidobacteria bacterium]|nr:phosphoribosyltransferase family protein [Acidobacteriota bacterium]
MDLTRAFRRLRPRNTSRPLSGTTGAGRGRGCGWWWVPEVVVLVDDVSTTGATLEACARVLKQAGVKEVRALTAARVASRPT